MTNLDLDIPLCPACDSDAAHTLLGQLGNRRHWRCRDCGIDFSEDASEDLGYRECEGRSQALAACLHAVAHGDV